MILASCRWQSFHVRTRQSYTKRIDAVSLQAGFIRLEKNWFGLHAGLETRHVDVEETVSAPRDCRRAESFVCLHRWRQYTSTHINMISACCTCAINSDTFTKTGICHCFTTIYNFTNYSSTTPLYVNSWVTSGIFQGTAVSMDRRQSTKILVWRHCLHFDADSIWAT